MKERFLNFVRWVFKLIPILLSFAALVFSVFSFCSNREFVSKNSRLEYIVEPDQNSCDLPIVTSESIKNSKTPCSTYKINIKQGKIKEIIVISYEKTAYELIPNNSSNDEEYTYEFGWNGFTDKDALYKNYSYIFIEQLDGTKTLDLVVKNQKDDISVISKNVIRASQFCMENFNKSDDSHTQAIEKYDKLYEKLILSD